MGLGTLLKQIDAESVGLHELTTAELLNVQSVLVNMLQDIANVCEENKISWCLFGGSALGAVRNGGIIPWDDDIDIIMPREDYSRFRKVFLKSLSLDYELKEPGDKGYLMHYPQIYKKGTNVKLIQSENDTRECLFIDIFPMEDTFDGRLRRNLHGARCSALLFIDSVLRMERCRNNLLKYSANNQQVQKELRRRMFFAKFFHFHSLEEWLRRSDQCFSKVINPTSKYVVVPSGTLHYWGELYDRKKMTNLLEIPFCYKTFYIMKDYDYYLKKRYGEDYMTPPPENALERHVYIQFDLGEKHKAFQGDNKYKETNQP